MKIFILSKRDFYYFFTFSIQTTDLSLIASRLILSLDDVQWVFTVAQVHASMLCVKSIFDIIKNSMKHERNLENKVSAFKYWKKKCLYSMNNLQYSLSFFLFVKFAVFIWQNNFSKAFYRSGWPFNLEQPGI